MQISKDNDKSDRRNGLGVRHVQTLFLFLSMFLCFTMRVNMSMAIVDMTTPASPEEKPDFDWTYQVQSVILSSFFWGYVVLQIPSAELSRRWGGKNLLITSMTINSAVSMFIPTGARMGGWQLVCACRVLQGLTQACLYPSMHHLVSQWIPLEEKGLLASIIYAGGVLGIAAQMIVSGFIADAWGWPAIFYTNGTLGILWTISYFVYGSASPEQSKIISKQEVAYIQNSLGRVGEQKPYPTPWRKIMTSLPFWALIVTHCGQNWSFFTLMTETPTYMAKILHFKLTANGIYSCLPYLATYALSLTMGAITDLVVRKKWMSITHLRKLNNTIGIWGPALALIGLAYTPHGDKNFAVIMLILAVGLNGGVYCGFMVNHIDLAPNFSATLMGITNFLSNIISIIAPLVCGVIVRNEEDPTEWRKVFFVSSAIYFFSNLFFILFGTSERQSWNEPKKTDESDIEMDRTAEEGR